MFETHYRSSHEPDVLDLTETVKKVILKKVSNAEVISWLETRDRKLNLEVEASHPLGYLAPWLPTVFPEAKFVITIREPLAWLRSRLNFHFYKTPKEWQPYRDFIWGRHHQGYKSEETQLEELGLYSLDAYLSQYSEQYQLLFDHLPKARTLLIKTEHLNESLERVASFLMVSSATISRQHTNTLTPPSDIIERLPENFVTERIEESCGWMESYLRSSSTTA